MSGLIKSNGNKITQKGGGLAGMLKNQTDVVVTNIAQPDMAFVQRYLSNRIGFIIDATASRSRTWDNATEIQNRMFEKSDNGNQEIRLISFGGDVVKDLGWHKTADSLINTMNKVDCRGGITQFVESLQYYIDEEKPPKVVVIVGDSFEEKKKDAYAQAEILKQKDIKIFTFFEGDDDDAKKAFQKMSAITGGGWAKFGSSLEMEDLFMAIKAFAGQGEAGLKQLALSGNKGAKQIGHSMGLKM